MADYSQAFRDRFDRERQVDAWFLFCVRAAVWSQDRLQPSDFYDDGVPQMTVGEKRAMLKAKAEALWPKAQP